MVKTKKKLMEDQENLLNGAPERASINSGNNWKQSLIRTGDSVKVQNEKQHTIWEVK